MNVSEMRAAVIDARNTLRSTDMIANDLAYLLKGRLRSVNAWHLETLKRELRDFNIHTGKWKA